MTKRDVLELKRRLKKSECSFTKMAGCYVNANKEQVLTFEQDFRDLGDDEYFKYLDLANKVLSGKVGNNLLKLDFSEDACGQGGQRQILLGIRESSLLNHELLETFYQHVIENFAYAGNYLILLFRDSYDVPLKSSDNMKLGESEEVYEYILCAVCPVDLSKPALGYRADENRIGARIRDWVVGMPEMGFVFPLFDERSANIHSTLFYTKNTKEPHRDFMQEVLGCGLKKTTNEKKQTFRSIVIKASGSEEKGNEVFSAIQGGFNDIIEEAVPDESDASFVSVPVLTKDAILGLSSHTDIPELITEKIADAWDRQIPEEEEKPEIKQMIDKKLAREAARDEKERELVRENAELRQKLMTGDGEDPGHNGHEDDVMIRVSDKKAGEVKARFIDGHKYVIIPIDEESRTFVNREELKV